MGSKKLLLVQSLKRVTALATVMGVVGGTYVGYASAQTAQFLTRNQQAQQASFDMPDLPDHPTSGVELPSPAYSPIPPRNSARILGSPPSTMPHAAQQATVNRRALVGHGRMISTGFRQESDVLGSLPQDGDPSVLQRDDKPQDFFGDGQPMPTVPRNAVPQVPVPNNPEQPKRQDGELPSDVFEDPFKDERRDPRGNPSSENPNQATPTLPRDSDNGSGTRNDPDAQPQQNPFAPETIPDDQIDYQSGRVNDTTRSRSNVYRAPGSDDLLEQQQNGIYFVPAYDPIPGTHQPTMAPPAMMQPHYGFQQEPAWPDQSAAPIPQQHYQHPQYQQPQYQHPHYQQPYYQQPPAQYTYPPEYAPSPETYPEQQVYSSVVQPPINSSRYSQGPMTTARRGLLGKLKRDLKKDWGFGDYQSCQNAGNCGGCNSGCGSACGSTCPVFYFGFQAAWNDAYDVANDQGSELLLDDGTAFFFSLGRMNGRNLRTEVELSFRDNDVSSLLTPNGEVPLTGDLRTFSGMANAYWEFVNSPTGRFKPYLGGGVGFLSATADLRLASDPMADSQADSSSSFAYQWMAGVNFKVSNHLDVYGEYRFLDAESFSIPSERDDLTGDFGYSANSVGGGLRWKF